MSFVTWDLHNLSAAPAWRGAIDYVDGERLRGWAISATNPAEPVPLNIRLCGVALPAMVCDVAREDIAQLFDVAMRPGFDLAFAQLPADSAARLAAALAGLSEGATLADVLEIRLGESELRLPFSPGVAQQALPRTRLQQTLAPALARQPAPLQVIALLHRDLGPRAEPGLPMPWTQIAATRALFPGHVQPRLPTAELGFYDSRAPSTLLAQIEQARAQGVTGFCYQHRGAWDAAALQDDSQPWRQHLASAAEFGFCLHWQLEAGQAAEQAKTFAAALGLLDARRYIRLAGRPLLLVSGLEHLPAPAQTLAEWRQTLRQTLREGAARGGELHLSAVESALCPDPVALGADSGCPLWPVAPAWRNPAPTALPPTLGGPLQQGDYAALVAAALTPDLAAPPPAHLRLGCALPGFDDSPLHGAAATLWHGATPALFAAWVAHLARQAQLGPAEGRAIILNSWDGWAQGTGLEPDQNLGPARQQALREALAGPFAEASTPKIEALQRQLAGLTRANAALTALLEQRTAATPEDHGGFVAAAADLLRVIRHPEGHAQLDRVNGMAPPDLQSNALLPVPMAGGLALSGWVTLPETDAFPALLALRDAQGQRHVALLRHADPHPDTPHSLSFRFRGTLQNVPPGRYHLELLRPDRADPGLALSADLGCEILIG